MFYKSWIDQRGVPGKVYQMNQAHTLLGRISNILKIAPLDGIGSTMMNTSNSSAAGQDQGIIKGVEVVQASFLSMRSILHREERGRLSNG